MILDGVRVVEVAAWVAGPAAAGVLADWGADVVKVEPTSGDPQRNIFGAVGVRDQRAVPRSSSTTGASAASCSTCGPTGVARRWSGCSPAPTCS